MGEASCLTVTFTTSSAIATLAKGRWLALRPDTRTFVLIVERPYPRCQPLKSSKVRDPMSAERRAITVRASTFTDVSCAMPRGMRAPLRSCREVALYSIWASRRGAVLLTP